MRRIIHFSLLSLALMLGGCSSNKQYNPSPKDRVVDQTYVHKYGVTVKQDDWAQRGKDGKVITVLSSGVEVTNSYDGGVLHGDTSYTYPHTKIIAKVDSYAHGVLVKEVEFTHSGTPKRQVLYACNPGEPEKTITLWYETGTPSSIEMYQGDHLVGGKYFSPDHVVEAEVIDGIGSRINRDVYGQLISNDQIAGGELVKRTTFHPNGTPSEIIPFRNNVIHGEKMAFYPGGEPKSLEEWVNGKQNGMTMTFLNGEKISEVPYVSGAKHGVEKRFRNGETVVEEIHWLGNSRHGPSKTYIGEVLKTDWFYRGQKVTKTNYERMENKDSASE